MINKTDEIASKHLGKKVEGAGKYSPGLLVGVPREENRKAYDISNNELPFEGYDVWHAYEFSSLTRNNLPYTKLLKIKYNCNNEFLVESKSLKLYFNSLNMDNFGDTVEESMQICRGIIAKDLGDLLGTDVSVEFVEETSSGSIIFEDFVELISMVDERALKVEQFKEAPECLEVESLAEKKSYKLRFSALRSNCRVTHQPDFGDAFIYYKSQKHIKETSLIKYLSSFRSEYHFHEECCEMIYKRLYDLLDAEDELFVGILYTRRGGIDICPVRYSSNCTFRGFEPLLDVSKYCKRSEMQ